MGESASGILGTEPENLNGVILPGGCGGIDTSGRTSGPTGVEESEGAASYWGSSPAPGAGSGAHKGHTQGSAGDGFVMFEWN